MNLAIKILKENISIRLEEKERIEKVLLDNEDGEAYWGGFNENSILNLSIQIKQLQHAIKVILEEELKITQKHAKQSNSKVSGRRTANG